jgi:hypothetical protein
VSFVYRKHELILTNLPKRGSRFCGRTKEKKVLADKSMLQNLGVDARASSGGARG